VTDIRFDFTRRIVGDRWWVIGREPGTRRWAIAVRADTGRI
jgi:hypothetical protein